jgi:hypothetical protein
MIRSKKKCKFVPVFKAYVIGMKHFINFLFIVGLFPVVTLAQSNASFPKPALLKDLQTPKEGQGSIQIMEDAHISDLLARHLEINRRINGIIGYRILIYKESHQNSKKAAFEVKSQFLKNFPGLEVYYIYEQPESKLFVGDFRTKSDAMKLKVQVEKYFPKAIILETKINFPKLDK